MALTTLALSVHVAWWVRPYIRSLALVCWLTGMEPDMSRVERVLSRGIGIRSA